MTFTAVTGKNLKRIHLTQKILENSGPTVILNYK